MLGLPFYNILCCPLVQPCSEVCFVQYKCYYPSFLFISICTEYLSPSPQFHYVCFFRSEVSLLWEAYIWLQFFFFFNHSATLCIYLFTHIYLLLFCSFCSGNFYGSFSFFSSSSFFSCDLMTIFSDFLWLPSFVICVYLLQIFGFMFTTRYKTHMIFTEISSLHLLLSSTSGTSVTQIVCLTQSHRFLKLPSFLKFFFYLFICTVSSAW